MLPFASKKKLKVLQWDKINQLTINKTLWANLSDEEIIKLLGGEDGVFRTIEELFAAKEIALKSKFLVVLF
jgi:hypothetical protein